MKPLMWITLFIAVGWIIFPTPWWAILFLVLTWFSYRSKQLSKDRLFSARVIGNGVTLTHAFLKLTDNHIRLYKGRFFRDSAPWLDAPYDSVEEVSLSAPNLILHAPTGVSLRIDFGSQSKAEDALRALHRRLNATTESQPQAPTKLPAESSQLQNTTAQARPEIMAALQMLVSSRDSMRAAAINRHTKQMWLGLATVIVGVGVTLFTYFRAVGSGGGLYFILWGAMLIGPIWILRGFVGWVKSRPFAPITSRQAASLHLPSDPQGKSSEAGTSRWTLRDLDHWLKHEPGQTVPTPGELSNLPSPPTTTPSGAEPQQAAAKLGPPANGSRDAA